MIVVVYQDEGPSGPGGQTTEATRPHRAAFLFDSREAMEEFLAARPVPGAGRKQPRVEVIDPEEGDVVRDERNRCPVPSPLGEERLAEIRRADAAPEDAAVAEMIGGLPNWAQALVMDVENDRRALLAHLDFLHTILNGSEADAYAAGHEAGRAKGFSEGAEAQKKIDRDAAHGPAIKHSRWGHEEAVAVEVSEAIQSAPLAQLRDGVSPTPPRGRVSLRGR